MASLFMASWLWDVLRIQETARTNKQPLTWVSFVNYISKLNLYMDTCFREQPFFSFFLIKGILCQQTESARWWLPPRPASDFSKCAIVQSELCFIDLFHGRGKITSGLLPVRNNNGVLFCCLYFLGQTSVVKIFNHSCVERVGGLWVEMVPSIGWWSGDNPLIYRFIYGSCWLGEMRWVTGRVKAKTYVRSWEKSKQCFSNCSKRSCFICTAQSHRAFWIYGNPFFSESACWLLFLFSF